VRCSKKLVGLNEIKLGVPVPYLADCMLRSLVGSRIARLITDGGDFYPPESAYDLGLVDEILEMDALIPASLNRVRKIAENSLAAFAKIKQDRIEPTIDDFEKRKETKQEEFIELWYSADTRDRLKEAILKF
jgi:enoyl-CoA hydratase/carnithine racemase